jgi:hypothetical protein
MKRARYISIFLLSLIALVVILLLTGCKKQSITEYKVVRIDRGTSLPCKYILRSDSGKELEKYDFCGKYKQGQVVLRVVE